MTSTVALQCRHCDAVFIVPFTTRINEAGQLVGLIQELDTTDVTAHMWSHEREGNAT